MPAFTDRRFDLPHDRTLLIREATPADIDGIAALYAGLEDDARCRRFFTLWRPPREFFERIALAAERGGGGVVAIVRDTAGRELVAGEASYELLANGNGELEITVARAWRGWLGASLLDALLDVARCRGLVALEAEILSSNLSMLALVRHRGYVTVPDPEWSELRVVIGVESAVPGWPPRDERPRLLIEGSGVTHWRAQDLVSAPVVSLACAGPSGSHIRCPALDGSTCALARDADAILVVRRGDEQTWHDIVAHHEALCAGVPVLLEERGREADDCIVRACDAARRRQRSADAAAM